MVLCGGSSAYINVHTSLYQPRETPREFVLKLSFHCLMFISWTAPIPSPFSVSLTLMYWINQELPQLLWLSGFGVVKQTWSLLPVRFLIRAHVWGAGQVPSRGHERDNWLIFLSHTDVSLPFSFPPLLSKIYKWIKSSNLSKAVVTGNSILSP